VGRKPISKKKHQFHGLSLLGSGAYRDTVCVRAFIELSVLAYLRGSLFREKKDIALVFYPFTLHGLTIGQRSASIGRSELENRSLFALSYRDLADRNSVDERLHISPLFFVNQPTILTSLLKSKGYFPLPLAILIFT
jgi:hypothetical protein